MAALHVSEGIYASLGRGVVTCFRRAGWKWWAPSPVILLLAGFGSLQPSPHASAVAGHRRPPSRSRVFPEITAGVTAMKRDSAGRYYVLTTPANIILIFSPERKRIGQIPQANSATAKIQFAVDFDLDANGRILVADRAANAVEIFSPTGGALSRKSRYSRPPASSRFPTISSRFPRCGRSA
jgi:hypothetical protein